MSRFILLKRIHRPLIINSYLRSHNIRKLQLGAGETILNGWLNTDLHPYIEGLIFLDVTQKFPFKEKTFDYILSEHLIEHLTYLGGLRMLEECFRVLRPGGKIRIATPDLDIILGLRNSRKTELQQRYIKYHMDHYLPDIGIDTDIFVINNAFRGFGHRFIYDHATLYKSLVKTGFIDITRHAPGESNDEMLRGIDCHAKDEMLSFTGLVLEAKRPA